MTRLAPSAGCETSSSPDAERPRCPDTKFQRSARARRSCVRAPLTNRCRTGGPLPCGAVEATDCEEKRGAFEPRSERRESRIGESRAIIIARVWLNPATDPPLVKTGRGDCFASARGSRRGHAAQVARRSHCDPAARAAPQGISSELDRERSAARMIGSVGKSDRAVRGPPRHRCVAEALAGCALPDRRRQSSGGTFGDICLWPTRGCETRTGREGVR